MEDYKSEIIATRKGCLGGSDAKMLEGIAAMGYVPKSAKKRLAVCKGLIEQDGHAYTKEMRFGDFIEQKVFEHLREADERWQSNPCLESKIYSRKNVKCIDHVDLFLQDDDKHLIVIGEVKASKDTFQNVRYTYKAQLAHHHLLGMEYARRIISKKKYGVKVYLCHYDTSDLDLNDDFVFDIRRLTIHTVRFFADSYKLDKAMDIVNDFLETFDVYYEGDEVDSRYLPDNVKKEFNNVTSALEEIKQRERMVNEFKERLYQFMVEKNIKSIVNDSWCISRVDATESVSFDQRRFLEDFEKEHPQKAKKLKQKYEKRTKRKGYALIRLRDNVND